MTNHIDPALIPEEMVEAAARRLAAEFGYDGVFHQDEGTNYDADYWRHTARVALAAAFERLVEDEEAITRGDRRGANYGTSGVERMRAALLAAVQDGGEG